MLESTIVFRFIFLAYFLYQISGFTNFADQIWRNIFALVSLGRKCTNSLRFHCWYDTEWESSGIMYVVCPSFNRVLTRHHHFFKLFTMWTSHCTTVQFVSCWKAFQHGIFLLVYSVFFSYVGLMWKWIYLFFHNEIDISLYSSDWKNAAHECGKHRYFELTFHMVLFIIEISEWWLLGYRN